MYSLIEPENAETAAVVPFNDRELATTNVTHCSSPKHPEMWFNPSTNRWCSKSCRRYRELIRDQELIKRGMRPGPQKQSTRAKKRKQMEEAPESPKREPSSLVGGCDTRPLDLRVASDDLVRPGDLNFRQARDAYFAKYGL